MKRTRPHRPPHTLRPPPRVPRQRPRAIRQATHIIPHHYEAIPRARKRRRPRALAVREERPSPRCLVEHQHISRTSVLEMKKGGKGGRGGDGRTAESFVILASLEKLYGAVPALVSL